MAAEAIALLDETRDDTAENLALDEALLVVAEEHLTGPVLRLWQPSTFAVILGAAGQVEQEVERFQCERDGVPILRRSSGGGTVLIGPGCLNFTLVLPYPFAPGLEEILPSVRYILSRVKAALERLPPLTNQLALEGISDLTCGGRKVSGNAQQRKRRYFLHHGTLLCGMDLGRVSRYLPVPSRQPAYRCGRSHADFLTNLPIAAEQARQVLIAEWNAVITYPAVEAVPQTPTVSLAPTIDTLLREKYRNPDWTFRR